MSRLRTYILGFIDKLFQILLLPQTLLFCLEFVVLLLKLSEPRDQAGFAKKGLLQFGPFRRNLEAPLIPWCVLLSDCVLRYAPFGALLECCEAFLGHD